MTTAEKSAETQSLNIIAVPREGKLDPLLGRIDLLAVLLTLFGICVLGVAAVVLALIEIAKLISAMLADPFERWLLLALSLAILWLIFRGKKLCVF